MEGDPKKDSSDNPLAGGMHDVELDKKEKEKKDREEYLEIVSAMAGNKKFVREMADYIKDSLECPGFIISSLAEETARRLGYIWISTDDSEVVFWKEKPSHGKRSLNDDPRYEFDSQQDIAIGRIRSGDRLYNDAYNYIRGHMYDIFEAVDGDGTPFDWRDDMLRADRVQRVYESNYRPKRLYRVRLQNQ